MTAPTNPTTPARTPTQAAPEVRFGGKARLEIAPWNGGVEPAPDQFTYFCATDQIEIGSEQGKETINNFCTGGNDVEVSTGSEKATLTTGDAFWTEKDKAIQILENAYDAPDEENRRVWYRYYPLGKGEGKLCYRGLLDVSSWKMTAPSKGFIKMAHGLNPLGKPEKGTVNAAGVFTPKPAATYTVAAANPGTGTQPVTPPAAVNGGALGDTVAANLADLAAGQEATYTFTSTTDGDAYVTVTGASADRTVGIFNAAGQQVATGTNTANSTALPAGTYTVRVSGAAASTGGTVTADFM